ncbi:MAG: hypothetical protein ACL93V_03740 [Candidatus Electrothrix sp. YB6]
MLDAEALIRADNEARRIHIAVSGTKRKVYLTVIMLTLRKINSSFQGLKVSERVPISDDPKRSDCRAFFSDCQFKSNLFAN